MVRGKCTVCDSPNATNYHFGAQSCKACAAFFRRSIAMRQDYSCLGDGFKACRIDHTLRLNCRHCRLKKCLRAGMLADLVQAKREIKMEKSAQECRKYSSHSEEQLMEVYQPNTSSYFDQPTPVLTPPNMYPPPPMSDAFYQLSENEWDYSPPSEKCMRMTEDLMGYDELQQFIMMPTTTRIEIGADDFQPTDAEIRSRVNSVSDAGGYFMSFEEEERLQELAALYTDLVVNINVKRRITYTDNLIASAFDGACVCPYDRTNVKSFDHRTYRQKNRNDYLMIIDYITRFPGFQQLTKSEKTVLFRTAAAVDILVDQAYYSQIIFPNEEKLVTANGECLSMNPLPQPEFERSYRQFDSDEEYEKYKALTEMKVRQWTNTVEPLKKMNMSLTEFALFKALTIWHYNHFKLDVNNGRQVSSRQRADIFRTLLMICVQEDPENGFLRASELVLNISTIMLEIRTMVEQYIQLIVFDTMEDPILKDMLTFQY
ncbi:unnamed protein product [Caenorhabditis sp. 36 PRJEB53466]|nr:unnamed protein product [Caenorhabditis sp. 36 PRJEB53466]